MSKIYMFFFGGGGGGGGGGDVLKYAIEYQYLSETLETLCSLVISFTEDK